jgi:hypothetical protein
VFTQGPGRPDLSLINWAINFPPAGIAGIALIVGFRGRAIPQPA